MMGHVCVTGAPDGFKNLVVRQDFAHVASKQRQQLVLDGRQMNQLSELRDLSPDQIDSKLVKLVDLTRFHRPFL